MSTFSYTCLNCRVVYDSSDAQKAHYKSDWHRYNLKRKVAELPPVTEENFLQRASAVVGAAASSDAEKDFQRKNAEPTEPSALKGFFSCKACCKSFGSQKTHEHHLQSKKHQEQKNRIPESCPRTPPNSDGEVVHKLESLSISENASESEVQKLIQEGIENARRLTLLDCMFCDDSFDSFEMNMDHMTQQHSLYIPDIDYLVDLPGLITFLGEKITVYHVCIYCDERSKAFRSLDAVRKHMTDKGHCKVFYQSDMELDIAQFYDYSDLFEDVSDDECVTEGAVSSYFHGEHAVVCDDESEMILPSGARIGNRAYKLYYRQRFRPNTERESFVIKRLNEQYKSLGWSTNAFENKTPAEVAAQRHQTLSRLKAAVDLGVRHSGLQRHFRKQIL